MKPRIFTTAFPKVYLLLVQKAEKKGRTKEEVDTVTCWLILLHLTTKSYSFPDNTNLSHISLAEDLIRVIGVFCMQGNGVGPFVDSFYGRGSHCRGYTSVTISLGTWRLRFRG